MTDDLVFRLKQMEEFFHLDYHRIKKIGREAANRIEKLEEALLGIRVYGNDTMSGPADGSEDNRNWYRGAVIVMKNRARKALEKTDA